MELNLHTSAGLYIAEFCFDEILQWEGSEKLRVMITKLLVEDIGQSHSRAYEFHHRKTFKIPSTKLQKNLQMR